jgi:hypothetical protein
MILSNTVATSVVLNGATSTVNTPADESAPQGFMPSSNGKSWVALPGPAAAVYTDTYASTTSIDWSLGGIHLVTLTGNVTFSFANVSVGQTIRLVITQDGTGSRTGTFPSGCTFVGGQKTLTTTNGATDTVDIQCTATGTYLCSLLKAYA